MKKISSDPQNFSTLEELQSLETGTKKEVERTNITNVEESKIIKSKTQS